ncbi:MAG: tetratricopeptide repeat protein [Xenococcaceae cyanobacterium MO_167.B52]|nr:tetratricopeptide repeat protein [Xenococcaceae cyanobacterium MO_167.B52]
MSDPDYTIPVSAGANSDLNSKVDYGYKTLNRGDIIGDKYEIDQELGCGGFATTYLATAIASENFPEQIPYKCVIKQLQPRFNSPAIWENSKERLDTEGNILKSLGQHDRIPQFLDYFEENGQFYLVLEFVKGEEFEHEVQRQILTEPQVIDFLWDVLEVLDFVHQKGIVHRDIKPTNLIRRMEDGKMVLIDFGAVKEIGSLIIESDGELDVAHTQVIGTPGYMPPEQNHGNPTYSSDIYALGKTAIYGLTGKSPTELAEFETNEGITWQETTQFSSKLIEILQAMVSPKVAERYNSVQEVIEDLVPLRQIGKIIQNHYYLEKHLGGQDRVNNYLVKDISESEIVYYFLKKLSLLDNSTEEVSQTLQQIELKINQLKQFKQQEQIPGILNYFVEDNNIYLLQKYIEGDSIAQLIAKKSSISELEIVKILLDTAQILSLIHKQKIIHNNIQPSSLWRRKSDGKIFFYNFALIEEIVNDSINHQSDYAFPKSINNNNKFQADIYGLGLTSIHWLTGITPQNILAKHEAEKTSWQDKLQVNPRLVKVLAKMINTERKQSYCSSNHLIRELKKIQNKTFLHSPNLYIFLIAILLVLLGLIGYFGLVVFSLIAVLEFDTAELEFKAGRYESALIYYNEGLKKIVKTKNKVRHFEKVWLKKAEALSRLKRHEEALETCTEALKHHQSHQLWNCQGVALANLRQYEAAIAAYNKALAVKENDPWLWSNRGESHLKLEQYDQAIADFEQAIQIDPQKSFIPWNNIGKLYYQRGNYEQAIEAYKKSIFVKDDYVPALIGLGNAKKSLGKSSLALQAYNKALQFNPKSYEAWYSKGLIEESLLQYQEAMKAYEKAIQFKPNWKLALDAVERIKTKMDMTDKD